MKHHWEKVNNRRAQELLIAKVDQLFRAIGLCMEHRLWEPTLILLYSGIDAMAWLDREVDKSDVTARDFISWCDRYLLDPADEQLRSEDLYAARCGLLHSHTGESRRHREGKAVKLFYSRSMPEGEVNLDQLAFEPVWPLWVDLDVFLPRFRQQLKSSWPTS